jgi:glycosyltransferase involved in cell wall biosynthesis
MSSLISVIVPVYKVEAYLEKCVNSIINQTYRNLEIILVDDGSPDNCPQMCDEIAKLDERIVVIHKQNGGLSSARNAGIDAAKGEYIGFVDSDDYIHPEMYERMYKALTAAEADLCICSYEMIYENREKTSKDLGSIKNEVLTRDGAFGKLFAKDDWYYVMAPMKLYKKALFSNLRFELGRLHEDTFLVHHLFGKCNCVVTISDKLYMYLQRGSSIMHTMSSKNYLCLIDAHLDRYQYFIQLKYKDFAKKSLMSAYAYIVRFINSGTYKDNRNELKNKIRLVSGEMIRTANPRVIKLWYLYIKSKR